MNYPNKCIAYVKRTIPNYVYNTSDFMVMDNGNGPFIGYWNPSMVISQPTDEQLDSITQEEYDNSIKQKIINTKIEIFDTENDILNPIEGSTAYINNSLKIYKNGIWINQEQIENIQKKTVVDVGDSDVILTATQLLSGIVEGEPIGNRTWTLPSAADVIAIIPDKFVNKTFTTFFNNNSTTKLVKISLGPGMTIKKNLPKFQDSITLSFRLVNIDPGTELIAVYKN